LPARIGDHAHARVAHVPLQASVAATRTVGIVYLSSQARQRPLQLLIDAGYRSIERKVLGSIVSCVTQQTGSVLPGA